jgi:hypothetical protein
MSHSASFSGLLHSCALIIEASKFDGRRSKSLCNVTSNQRSRVFFWKRMRWLRRRRNSGGAGVKMAQWRRRRHYFTLVVRTSAKITFTLFSELHNEKIQSLWPTSLLILFASAPKRVWCCALRKREKANRLRL